MQLKGNQRSGQTRPRPSWGLWAAWSLRHPGTPQAKLGRDNPGQCSWAPSEPITAWPRSWQAPALLAFRWGAVSAVPSPQPHPRGAAPCSGPAGAPDSGGPGCKGLGGHRLSWGLGQGWPLFRSHPSFSLTVAEVRTEAGLMQVKKDLVFSLWSFSPFQPCSLSPPGQVQALPWVMVLGLTLHSSHWPPSSFLVCPGLHPVLGTLALFLGPQPFPCPHHPSDLPRLPVAPPPQSLSSPAPALVMSAPSLCPQYCGLPGR